MKSVIVGTAGHIDHGKTALVKALTGIDADRLEEEKRRGITIDIGFAHLELPGQGGEVLRLGFVDVPGHERFVRNMLAGVGGIDLVLLVIAADDGIKPQTREHFDICRLLGVRGGITVLTKSDLVDRETLDVVRLEAEEFLRGSFLDNPKADHPKTDDPKASDPRAAIIPVSSLTGAGIDDLKRALVTAAVGVPEKDPNLLARLPIDRVFTMKGFGTVVTGTLVSGGIAKESELEVFPTGKRVRMRGVQVHGKPAEEASAGQRTALNLAGIATDELARGMTLAPPATFRSTSRVDVSLSLLPSVRPLKDRARVHFHAYTSETIATVALFVEKQITPGQSTFAHLRLAEPELLLPGDRFIIRQFSPVMTIGGGIVLDASPLARNPQAEETLAFFQTIAKGSPEQILLARVSRRKQAGLRLAEVVAEMNLPMATVRSLTDRLKERGELRVCGQEVLLSDAWLDKASESVAAAVKGFHDKNPLVAGIGKEELRNKTRLGPEVFYTVLGNLVKSRKLEATGELVHLPGRGVVMKDEEAASKKIIEDAFASAGLKVPALKDVLAELKVDKTRAQKIVTLLLREKVLVKISEELVFHREALENLRRQLAAEKAKSPRMDVARFKDLTGVSRKYAIPLLEYLDREHVTKRVGDERVIL